MEVDRADDQPRTRGRAGAALGLMSLALLLASFGWAHHWGALTYTIVAAWALTTLAALVVSAWSLDTSRASQRFATLGLVLGLVSVFALTGVGVLSAMGVDAAGECGGG